MKMIRETVASSNGGKSSFASNAVENFVKTAETIERVCNEILEWEKKVYPSGAKSTKKNSEERKEEREL